ncbi:MAG: AAA family ATPase [Candidatus Aenigmarchaeota archaeon]|nr:AAA family ATPase [Candidatus Aenigmarchaeota archaeon]
MIRMPKILDERLGKLLGIIISDGHIRKNSINVSGECSQEAERLGKEIFGIEPRVSWSRSIRSVDFDSKALAILLNEIFGIPVGKKSHSVAVPKLIFKSPVSVKAAFVAGILEGDGSIGNSDIRLNSASRYLAGDLASLLLSIGILSRIKSYNVYAVKPYGGYGTFQRFSDLVSPWMSLERKEKSLERLLKKAKRVSTIVYPLKDELYALRKKYGVRLDDSSYRYLSPNSGYRINSNVLGYVMQRFEGLDDEVVQEIRRIQSSDVVPVRISSVTVTEGGEMFDMTTEFSNFIGGEMPMIIHNTLMDGLKSRGKVIVIGATNRQNALDPALRRPGRFDREIELGIPDQKGRKEILQIHTRNMPLTKDVDLDWIASVSHGFVGADLEVLAKEAAMAALRRVLPEISWKKTEALPQDVLEKLKVTKADFSQALKLVEPSAMREVLIEIPDVKWKDIGGLEGIKQLLQEIVVWPMTHAEDFKRIGIKPPTGVLLYGPPGCGKTLIAKAVASETGANFISIRGPEITSKWVGESEKKIREIFRRAKQVAPAVIFFDEIDALATRRGIDNGSRAYENVVSQILVEMSGLEELHDVVVIAATNRPDILDHALLRPGRFEKQLLVPPPDAKSLLEILKIYTKKMPLDKDVDIKKMARQLRGYTGADIEALCREAGLNALRKNMGAKAVTKEDFEEAIKKARPSLNKNIIEFYEKIQETFTMPGKREKKKDEEEVRYVG